MANNPIMSMVEGGRKMNYEEYKHQINVLSQKTFQSLLKIWAEAGYEETECFTLLGDIFIKYNNMCSSEIQAEQQILDHAKRQVDDKFAYYKSLNEKLCRESPNDHSCMGSNYADKLAELEKRIFEIEKDINQRNDKIVAAKKDVESSAQELGEIIPATFDKYDIKTELSDARLEKINDYKSVLVTIRAKRVSEIIEIVKECQKCMTDLVLASEGNAAIDGNNKNYESINSKIVSFILNTDISSYSYAANTFPFGVHYSTVELLLSYLKALLLEKEKRRVQLTSIGSEIARLWTLLRIPATERDAFSSSFQMNLSLSTLKTGQQELTRLREIRKNSLEQVISTLRYEINLLWTEIGIITDEAKSSEYSDYFVAVEDLSDEAVEQHETYFTELKSKVEELRPLLLKIAKREAIVEERIELEHIMLNPERLTARGPNAREDRKKEELMQGRVKNLEKITKETLAQVATWEEHSGVPFCYGGERYADRVNSQEEYYLDYRNNLRNNRRKKDGKAELPLPPARTSNTATQKKLSATTPIATSSASSTPHHKLASTSTLGLGIQSTGKASASQISHMTPAVCAIIPNNQTQTCTTSGPPSTSQPSQQTPHFTLVTSTDESSGSVDINAALALMQVKASHEKGDKKPAAEQERFEPYNDENNDDNCSIGSDFSEITEFTSATEIKEKYRQSTSTVLKDSTYVRDPTLNI